MEISNVSFEIIDSRFSKGMYLGVEVIIDTNNGYVHGASLCAQVKNKNGSPKKFRDWLCTKQYKKICEYLLSNAQNWAPNNLIVDAPINLRGHYIHPYLVPHCAQWADSVFAHKVGVISEALVERDKTINGLHANINILNQKIDTQNKQINKLLKYAKTTKKELIETKDELLETKEILDDTRDTVTETALNLLKTKYEVELISNKLGFVRQEVVVPDPKLQNRFVFCVYQHNENPIDYKVFRCQIKCAKQAIKTCQEQGFTIQVYKIESPNSINLWNRVREKLPKYIGKIKKNNFRLAPSSTQKSFLEYLDVVNDEKKTYGDQNNI